MQNSKRHLIFVPIILFFFVASIMQITYLNVYLRGYYKEEFDKRMNRTIYGASAPRGRILDRNGNILVDNIGVKTINYTKLNDVKTAEEIKIARELAKIINLEGTASESILKNFWIITNEEKATALITEKEYEDLEYRRLTKNDIYNLKLARITKEDLEVFDETDILSARIYELMNKGYRWESKIIKDKDVTEEEFATLAEARIKGITLEQTWERTFPYGSTLRNIFGNISDGLPKEEREFYLTRGYTLNDRVGISYLEKQYEEYLKGEKNIYFINPDNTLSLYKEGRRGNDLILAIDINLQKKVEEILMSELKNGKKLPNTKYFNHAYVIISDPNDGSILAMTGKQISITRSEELFTDITTDIITASYPVGSVVKGASTAVGFQNDLIDVGKQIRDGCVKLYYIPQKCSVRRLGMIDDIKALQHSSNYYQFRIALSLTGNTPSWNMKLGATKEHFDIYRNTFAEFGLGIKTGIDLPNEKIGTIGDIIADDLLLNLSIGQYDSYTPIEILQYINTIATSGARIAPSLMLQIISPNGEVIKKNEGNVLNNVNIKPEHMKRIREGFKAVIESGTGVGHIDPKYNAAGKTGTAEDFKEKNLVLNKTFAMYTPSDNPKYSIVTISPHVATRAGNTAYTAPINRLITRKVSDFLLENY